MSNFRQHRVIQVFEHSSIAYKGKHKHEQFTESLFTAFEKYYNSNEATPFFSMIPYGVRFNQYVGAIHLGSTTIEVLPKAGKENDPKIWQVVLLQMLKTCHLLIAKATGLAPLRLRSNDILDLYFEWYLNELDYLIRRGLIKKYRQAEGQQNVLKGTIDFPKHIEKNLIHQERFFTRFTSYDQDHLIHQILFQGLLLVERISTSSLLRDQIGRQKLCFPEVKSIQVTDHHFNQIRMDRKNQPYQKALEIAKLILLNTRPDISHGKQDLLAIMFDMNSLWEEYVYRIIRRTSDDNWTIHPQVRDRFWEHKSIRPDIVLKPKDQNGSPIVIDTKWKTVEDEQPNDADLKQMFVYNHHWKCRQSILLYPRTKGQNDIRGTYHLPMDDKTHSCKLAFVDVLYDNHLNQQLATEIFKKIDAC